jgi:hypothetical protein
VEVDLDAFLAALAAAGLPLGGHSDEHAHGDASGCGANDQMGRILAVLGTAATAPFLATMAEQLGMPLEEEPRGRILEQAAKLAELIAADSLGSSAERLSLISQYGNAPLLAGGHTEQLVVLNQVPGTTLDRDALAAALGAEYSVFNVDTWAVESSTAAVLAVLETLATDEAGETGEAGEAGKAGCVPSAEVFGAALLFYNLGTALVLCAPEMPVAQRG